MCAERVDTLIQKQITHSDLFNNELLDICMIVDNVTEFNNKRFVEEERLLSQNEKTIKNHENIYHAIGETGSRAVLYGNQ